MKICSKCKIENGLDFFYKRKDTSDGYRSNTEEDVFKLNHYTNLQPLCSYINRNIKRDRLDYKKNIQ
jgi:hypothetical protein